MGGEEVIDEAIDPEGARVVLLARVWDDKVLRDHAELDGYLPEVLRAVHAPDHVEPDPTYEQRRRFHLRGVGPSRWLMVVVSYEQEPGADHLRVWEPKGPEVMERVNIRIGPVTFDHADYDAEHDVLYLHVGEPQPGEGEETPEGHVIRYVPGTSRIAGLTMLGPRRILERDGRLTVTIPETIETTADDLAPALAAG
ncbi:MAG TPA: hypothetical protein VN635_14625 [Conexibacter sp.]|nr:hypothetical protein [Conexibacter sp.]